VPNYYETLPRKDRGKITCLVTQRAMKERPGTVAQIMRGDEKAVGAIVGQVMRYMKGQSSIQLINEAVQARLQALSQRGAKCPRCEGPKECVRYRYKTIRDPGFENYWACEDCKPVGGELHD
jgi:hypothetical protein